MGRHRKIYKKNNSMDVTVDFLQSFADAFNAHNVKAIMSHMTDDCVFEASAGPDFDGEKFTGQKQVKEAFEKVFETFPDAHWGNPRHFVSGDRGVLRVDFYRNQNRWNKG
jgi:ketosteroid isomerase-like protein